MNQNQIKTVGTTFEYLRDMFNKKIYNKSNKKSFVVELALISKLKNL